MANYNQKATEDLFRYHENGIVELRNHDFTVNGIGEIIVAHPLFKGKNGLIMFYAPWCPHCKKHINMWTNLAMVNGTRFVIGAVNCEFKGNQLIQQYAQIGGYPTFKFVHKDGTMSTYMGPRNINAIQQFICDEAKICNFGPQQ